MVVIAAFVLQDIGDATSVSLLNLDASEHSPEVTYNWSNLILKILTNAFQNYC